MSIELSRRALLGAGLMVSTKLAAWPLTQLSGGIISRIDLEALVPRQFGKWHMIDDSSAILPNPEDANAAAAAYEHVVSRTYVRPDGAFVMMVLAHGRTDSGLLVLHRAEVCYESQGFTVQPLGHHRLEQDRRRVTTTRMTAERDGRREQVTYWATMAGQQTDLGVVQKLRVLEARLHGQPLDAFLVRASTISQADASAYALVDAFLRDMLVALPPDLRTMVAGAAMA